ncbi:hypothetical protein [Vibrio phage vB_VviC_ZQ26]|nr:hypothetical protein [Vibrio phage vB_VviC_ZQ26]
MSEAKFTKGEWFIEKDANWNDDCWAISVKRDYDDSVHHCFAEVTYKMEDEDSNPELEANAHLIAAAPEMYELLDSLYVHLDFIGDERYKSNIKTLLSKARGEK